MRTEGCTFSDKHSPSVIASSSLRRKAQWLHRFPADQIVPIRGNVNTRLKKLAESEWSGAIFAAAGLHRLGLRPANAIELDWMIPAPAQGAILVMCREKDTRVFDQCRKIHHEPSAFCVKIERDFLSTLLGGCSTPIGALAEIAGEEILFRGNLLDTSGEKKFSVEKKISSELAAAIGISAAHELLSRGWKRINRKKATCLTGGLRYYLLHPCHWKEQSKIPPSVEIHVIPFIEIVQRPGVQLMPVVSAYGTEKLNAIFTSAHAVKFVSGWLKQKPDWTIYCIRNETRNAVLKYFGTEVACKFSGNALFLSRLMISEGVRKALFFCGDQRLDILPDNLRSNGIDLSELVVYDTRLKPVKLKEPPEIILFFSPSAVTSFLMMNEISSGTTVIAMGTTTAAALK